MVHAWWIQATLAFVSVQKQQQGCCCGEVPIVPYLSAR